MATSPPTDALGAILAVYNGFEERNSDGDNREVLDLNEESMTGPLSLAVEMLQRTFQEKKEVISSSSSSSLATRVEYGLNMIYIRPHIYLFCILHSHWFTLIYNATTSCCWRMKVREMMTLHKEVVTEEGGLLKVCTLHLCKNSSLGYTILLLPIMTILSEHELTSNCMFVCFSFSHICLLFFLLLCSNWLF